MIIDEKSIPLEDRGRRYGPEKHLCSFGFTSISIATVASYAAIASAVIAAGTAAYTGIAASQTAKRNSKLARQSADIAKKQAASQEEAFRRQAARRMGKIQASYAASGVQLDDGTPLDVMQEQEIENEMEALSIRHTGAMSSRRFMIEADQFSYQASNAETGAYIGAGTAALGGLSKINLGTPSSVAGFQNMNGQPY